MSDITNIGNSIQVPQPVLPSAISGLKRAGAGPSQAPSSGGGVPVAGVRTLEELKKADKEFYTKWESMVAQNVCAQMKKDSEAIQKAMKKNRERE